MRSRVLFAFLLAASFVAPRDAWSRFPAALHTDHRYPNDITYDSLSHWDYISGFPTGVDTSKFPAYERAIGGGASIDTAWRWYTSGDPAVLIAVFDSGIQWDEKDLLNKHYLNRGELPPPQIDRTAMWPGQDGPGDVTDCTAMAWSQAGGEYDVNHDGVFNIRDYRCDSRVNPQDGVAHAADVLDPSDLIHARHADFTRLGDTDDDGNGFVDDIAGWDFMWNDNDPYDDTRYHHGTGEAGGSGGEVDNATGKAGACPDCMILNIRVSDSYVADTNNLAQGVVYATDVGAKVIQSALGPLTGSIFAQEAIDYAWEKGVVAIMSAADETSMHHFPISAGEHTVMVHAVVPNVDPGDMLETPPTTMVQFSNCTNYGGHLYLSTPSTTCSSGAVKTTAGVAGLLYSFAKQNALEPLTANEAAQLLRAGADDIHDPDAANNPKRFPSQEGWEQHFGYGRLNAAASLALMKAGKIPPEADLTAPGWFEVIDPSRTPKVKLLGHAAAPRGKKFDWEIRYAPGVEPLEDAFANVVASGESPSKVTDFGTWDLSTVDFDAAADYGDTTSADIRDKLDQFTFTLRLRVTDHRGLVGEFRKVVYLRKDRDMLPGFPVRLGSSGESSPKLADIDGDGRYDIVVALADGSVRVYDARGRLLPGWPAYTPVLDAMREKAKAGALGLRHAGVVATPAVGKLDGETTAVVVATLEGDIVAYGPDGAVLAGFPQRIDALDGATATNPVQILDEGYFASPVLYDLDADGTLEIIAAGMDGKLYLFDHQGNRVAPFPVEVRDPAVKSLAELLEDGGAGCPLERDFIAANPLPGGGYRSRIIGTPSVGDIDGDGRPEIVVGSGEIYPGFCESDHTGIAEGETRLYAYRLDGSQAAGFPMVVYDQTNILPFVSRGLPISPVLVDFDKNGASDLVYHRVAQLGGYGVTDAKGKTLLTLEQSATGEQSNFGSGGVFRSKPFPLLINYGTVADMDRDGLPDVMVGGVSSDMLVSLQNDGLRRDADHLLLGFSGKTGAPLTGFPRVMEDIQFFMNPSVADLDGDGLPEVLNGSGGFVLHAWNHRGERPAGWPKFTGQWLIASPAIGDIDGDGFLEVVVNTRDGYLYAWNTQGPTQRNGKNAVQWASFRHDNHNTGNADTVLPLQAGPDSGAGSGCSCDARASARRGADWPAALTMLSALAAMRLALRRMARAQRRRA